MIEKWAFLICAGVGVMYFCCLVFISPVGAVAESSFFFYMHITIFFIEKITLISLN